LRANRLRDFIDLEAAFGSAAAGGGSAGACARQFASRRSARACSTRLGFVLEVRRSRPAVLLWITTPYAFFLPAGWPGDQREIMEGSLSQPRRWRCRSPRVGGMAVPSVLYSPSTERPGGDFGLGDPAATDIAFSLGVLSALGSPPWPLALESVSCDALHRRRSWSILIIGSSTQIRLSMLALALADFQSPDSRS